MTEWLHFHFSLSCTEEGNGNPLQCSYLENPRDGSLVGCRLWGCTELDTTDVTKELQRPVCFLSHFSHVWLFATLWTVAPRLLWPWDSPGKTTGVGCHALLPGLFLAQGSNPVSYVSCISNRVLYHEHHLGSPIFLIGLNKWVHACKHLEQCLEHNNSQYMWAITTAMIYYCTSLY